MMIKQAGFKLFEFILVVILVCILFVFAISYYLQLGNEARRLTFQALAHNYSTAVTLAHAHWMIHKVNTAADQVVIIDNTRVSFNARGWPVDMIEEAGANTCERLFNGLIQNNTEAFSSWQGLLQATAALSTSGQENKLPAGFSISKMGAGWCRYTLTLEDDIFYFFDYISVDGQVNIHMTNK